MQVTHIQRNGLRTAACAATFALAACSGSGTSPQGVTTTNLSANVLQFAVGTANIYGDLGAGGSHGLNVVTTYRQPAGALNPGASAVLVSSPTITLPGVVPGPAGTADSYYSTVETGPGPSEIGTHTLGSTSQSGTASTSFGISGGAFGLGIEPFNYSTVGTPGTADAVAPYALPLLDTVASDPNAFVSWGGPPAFDPNHDGEGVRDGNSYPVGNAGDPTLGISEGLDVFAGIAPAVGTYTLGVSVPASTGTVVQTVTAAITTAAVLPAVTASMPVLDGKGGGSFPVVLPAGVTEAYVQVVDLGPAQPTSTTAPPVVGCNGSVSAAGAGVGPTYYTFEVKASGASTLLDMVGPSGTPSICTYAQNLAAYNTAIAASAGSQSAPADGDQFTVQVVGFDYPIYEASYPNSLGKSAPTIVGASGQSDVTVSSALALDQPAGAAPAGVVRVTLVKRARPLRAVRRR